MYEALKRVLLSSIDPSTLNDIWTCEAGLGAAPNVLTEDVNNAILLK